MTIKTPENPEILENLKNRENLENQENIKENIKENLKEILLICQSCKTINNFMKNKKICIECHNKKLKHCNICNKEFIGIDAHLKLHSSQNKEDSFLVSLLNAFKGKEKEYCKYCKEYIDPSKYYFSIKKCKDCHVKYKKKIVHCEKCKKDIKRSAFYKHSCIA
jgi:hypothetical protein